MLGCSWPKSNSYGIILFTTVNEAFSFTSNSRGFSCSWQSLLIYCKRIQDSIPIQALQIFSRLHPPVWLWKLDHDIGSGKENPSRRNEALTADFSGSPKPGTRQINEWVWPQQGCRSCRSPRTPPCYNHEEAGCGLDTPLNPREGHAAGHPGRKGLFIDLLKA